MKDYKPMGLDELLALTGQSHPDDFAYDRTLIIYIGRRTAKDQRVVPNPSPEHTDPVEAAAIGINLAEKRIVDIAVHPYFRKMGFGRAIVELAVQEYGVEFAYTVEEEAEKFWKAIGWYYAGTDLDKGTLVKRWVKPYE